MADKVIPIYRDRAKTRAAWADVSGSDVVVEASHEEGPPNEIYHDLRQIITSPSEQYRKNFDLIKWEN